MRVFTYHLAILLTFFTLLSAHPTIFYTSNCSLLSIETDFPILAPYYCHDQAASANEIRYIETNNMTGAYEFLTHFIFYYPMPSNKGPAFYVNYENYLDSKDSVHAFVLEEFTAQSRHKGKVRSSWAKKIALKPLELADYSNTNYAKSIHPVSSLKKAHKGQIYHLAHRGSFSGVHRFAIAQNAKTIYESAGRMIFWTDETLSPASRSFLKTVNDTYPCIELRMNSEIIDKIPAKQLYEDWVKRYSYHKHFILHNNDFLRYAYLYEEGGMYLDTDAWLNRAFKHEGNMLFLNMGFELNPGQVVFEKHSKYLLELMEMFIKDYTPDLFTWCGPVTLSRMYSQHPDSFKVFEKDAFFFWGGFQWETSPWTAYSGRYLDDRELDDVVGMHYFYRLAHGKNRECGSAMDRYLQRKIADLKIDVDWKCLKINIFS